MNDQQLRIFLHIADCGSFSKAEESLYISKQAMFKQINSLEDEVGCRLLSRSRTGVTLTKAGSIFYNGIRQLQDERAQLCEECRLAAGIRPTVRVSTVEHQVILSPVTALFTKQHPDVLVENVIHPNHSGEWRVANNIQDVAETSADYGSENPDPSYIPLVNSPYVAAMRKGHKLSGRESLSLSDLTGFRTTCFIMLGKEHIAKLQETFSQAPENLTVRSDVDNQVDAAYECAQSDTILITANPFVYSIGELAKVPLTVDWSREYGIIYHEPASYAVRSYVKLAVSYYRQNGLSDFTK